MRSKNVTADMPLMDHLRELRRRLVISAIAIVIGIVPGWIYYDFLFDLLRAPFDSVTAGSPNSSLTLGGVIDPFTLRVQVATVAGLFIASPVWLSQFWGFITPGLKKNERRWTLGFVVTALPLIFAGAYLAYTALPVGLQLLLGFTPENVTNLITVSVYFDFVFRTMLAFAIGFLAPLVLIALNFADLLQAQTIRKSWRGTVMVVLLFAAVATPTGDPLNMMLLAMPMLLLVVIAWTVAALNDRRRRRRDQKDQ
jgi:sec-independent protein translocase protein TatC